ncbi:HK97 family phage prohead protease [Calorimonas adulescens]|nr:HK97 family phage prohead protease [Calorimonas adulescens]
MGHNKPKTGIQQNRTFDMAIRAVKADERRVTVSFSSELAVNRWYGVEILQHDEGNVNLERLNNIGVALFNHDRNYVLGKIENARLAADEKRTYADIVFDTDLDADLIYQKVQNGTLKGVSVGYSVDVWEEVAPGKTSSNGRFTGPAYVAVKWTPLEISIVSVPADDTVGVWRNMEDDTLEPNNSISIFERQIQINKNFI